MSDRTPSSFPTENGWSVGNMNIGTPFHFPPYQNVPPEVPNFTHSGGPPQVPYPFNNFSSDSLKRNAEQAKFNAGFCPPYAANDVNPFECVKVPNSTSSYNHIQNITHPMQGSNHANFTPCAGNDIKNFPPPASQGVYFNSGSVLPAEQPNTFNHLPPMREVVPFQNLSTFPSHSVASGAQSLPFVQRPAYDVPPPVLRHPTTVENAHCGNFQQFPLPMVTPEPLQYAAFPNVPPPAYPFSQEHAQAKSLGSEKERLIAAFLARHQPIKKEKTGRSLTVAEFRSALKMGLLLRKLLLSSKQNLSSLLHVNENEWNAEMNHVRELKEQLSSVCLILSAPDNLAAVNKRLRTIRKKRALKSRLKQESSFCRMRKICEREALHQEIDKWLDGIKEKNLKLKREVEMKKEADNILSEVRRKIHEVKRATEKLNVFEKLRATRQANAEQKGLFVSSEHRARFCERMSALRSTLCSQLLDYEGEEHALRVMLEAEQEGQLEEEAKWRLQKTKALLRKKQQGIKEGLFGHTEEPSPTDDLFLFYQHQNAGNCSIDALVQIRHHWDVHLAENGETVPQQWVVPFPPSSTSWEMSLEVG